MRAGWRSAVAVNAVVALLATGLAVASLWPLLHLENGGPGARGFLYLPAWLLMAVAVNRGFAALQAMLARSWPKRIAAVAKYTLWLVIPPLILVHIDGAVVAKYTELVKRDSAPTVVAVHRALGQSDKGIREELHGLPVPHWIRNAAVKPASDVALLTAQFPSIDIDGFSMWYEARTRRWHRFHNDDPKADEWRARSQGMVKLKAVVYCERQRSGKLACL
jgi:hypothetical protein